MERRDKENSSFLFDLAYDQITSSTTYPYLNLILLFIQYALFLAKLYELVSPGYFQFLFSTETLFIGLSSLSAGLLLFTFISSYFQILPTIWIYWLLLIEALEMLYLQMGLQCFRGGQWCQSDPKLQTATLVVIGLMVVAVWLRSYCYCPFYEIDDPFAMTSGKMVLYTLLYSVFLGCITDQLIGSISASSQLAFLITIIFFAASCNPPPVSSPFMSRGYFVCGATLLWTSCLVWLLPLLEQGLGTTAGSIWHYWGFSAPVVICLSWVHSAKFNEGYNWRSLFFGRKAEENLRTLFLQVNQLVKFTIRIKKSDLRTIGPEFRELWNMAADHNEKCVNPDCPIETLKNMRTSVDDDLVEQKRFARTLEKILQFTLFMLIRQQDTHPNLLRLKLEIANFQLQVFHLRTKGLQLFNKEWRKGRSNEEQWSVYYLKRKIDGFEGDGEGIGEKEEEIEAFKHDIEVSVTMLAEFWYFLSDPKCNIKKLYDLANVLFPMKIGVDEAWNTVRTLKNIETYHLYARYLIRMFNDKEKGLKIMEEARRLQMQAHEKEVVLAGSEGVSEENGVIFLEFDGKKSGIMYQVNMACQKIFGYNKGELQGRKVNDIMPKLFAVHHDNILVNYQQTNKPRMMNKDRAVWGRAKDGYLFPFTICIKPVRNYFNQTSEVYASIKRELWVKEKGFFFVDNNLHITDVSASMLNIYPDIASRIHLKKKIHLSEIIPEPDKQILRLTEHRSTFEQSISRTYPVSSTATFTETITFGMQAEVIQVAASGPIGYHFRVFRGSGITSYQQKEEEEIKMEMKSDKRDFRLVASVGEDGKSMMYQGGISDDSHLLRSHMLSKISNRLEESRQLNNSEFQMQVRIDYAGDIKTKRLMGTVIRQIHELSQDSELNRAIGPDSKDEEREIGEGIKPSELNAILERKEGNKSIVFLKTLTIIMLGLSTLLAVLQYMSTTSNNAEVTQALSNCKNLSSLSAQLMALNQYANRIYMGSTVNLTSLGAEVNLLDSLTSSIPLDIESEITYRDGASQKMLLSFAVNKLISQSQVIASGLGDASTVFFVQYNTVNSLATGSELAIQELGLALANNISKQASNCGIYLIISGCLFTVILLVKNIVVRQVLHKKGEILNVFFQIPRYSCSTLQKECQRFIQRLSSDNNDEEELELDALHSEEGEDSSSRRRTQQKKRTIMGEQKTSSNFILISLLMLAFLLAYPTFSLLFHNSGQSKEWFAIEAGSQAMKIQMQLAQLNSLLDTHILQTSFPLQENSVPWTAINGQYQLNLQMLAKVTSNFFLLGKVLDQQYLNSYNQLFYSSLCPADSSAACRTTWGEDKGLNNILFNYYDALIARYQAVQSATPPYIASDLYSEGVQAQEEGFRLLMKQYWRQLMESLLGGIERLVVDDEGLLFGLLLAVCIINCTFLMWGWISFYNSLERKMMATEYILTFIPIDEINRNPKIVSYIKDQILRLQ